MNKEMLAETENLTSPPASVNDVKCLALNHGMEDVKHARVWRHEVMVLQRVLVSCFQGVSDLQDDAYVTLAAYASVCWSTA